VRVERGLPAMFFDAFFDDGVGNGKNPIHEGREAVEFGRFVFHY